MRDGQGWLPPAVPKGVGGEVSKKPKAKVSIWFPPTVLMASAIIANRIKWFVYAGCGVIVAYFALEWIRAPVWIAVPVLVLAGLYGAAWHAITQGQADDRRRVWNEQAYGEAFGQGAGLVDLPAAERSRGSPPDAVENETRGPREGLRVELWKDPESDEVPRWQVAGLALWNVCSSAAAVLLFHFVARAGLSSDTVMIRLLGLLPITLLLVHRLFVKNDIWVYRFLLPGSHPAEQTFPYVRQYGEWLFGRVVILCGIVTVSFSSWTTFWYAQGLFSTQPGFPRNEALEASERYYFWNLADAVPVLKIPETLKWDLGPTYSDWRTGLLLLSYKVILILPILYGIVELVRRTWTSSTPAWKKIFSRRAKRARSLFGRGDAAGALATLEVLLSAQLAVLGPDHPDILTTRNNLALARGEAGDWTDAVTAFEGLLADQLRILGPGHRDTLVAWSNLAMAKGEAGDPAAAAAEYEKVLAARIRVLGPKHPDTLASRSQLAVWRGEAGDAAGAATAYEDLWAERARVLGADHPDTLDARAAATFWLAKANGDASGSPLS
jgi:hypothetical protein